MSALVLILVSLFYLFLALAFLFTLVFGISIIAEKESGTVQKSLMISACCLLAGIGSIFLLSGQFFQYLLSAISAIITLAAVYYLAPSKKITKGTAPLIKGPVKQVDERDNIWARARTMHPDREEREEYKKYYGEMHPERKERDDKLFKYGVGYKGCVDKINYHNKLIGGVGINRFMTKLGTPGFVDLKPDTPDKSLTHDLSPQELTDMVKGLCKHLGAELVGVAELNQNWVYSNRGQIHYGNWQDWGTEVKQNHKYVVVFGFEMDLGLVRTAPYSPCDIEVYNQYSQAVIVSVQMAHILAAMGYEVKPHHLRAQEIMLVPVAVDAGLGELSRCNSLITKEFGTRVRLGAITTNAPLIVDRPVDIGGTEFCSACGKCAQQCPLGAIPEGDREVDNGSLRWKNDPEKCYEYWTKSGTHCSLCLSCCPWSHADRFPHSILKYAATHFYRLHKIMVWADDFFYGKRINSHLGPKWIDLRHEKSKQIMLDQAKNESVGS